MKTKLFINALAKFLLGIVSVGLFIFLPAGTVHYPGGQLLMAVLFTPMIILGAVLLIKKPDLLEKRLRTKEKSVQRRVVSLSALMFLGGFICAGPDFRFGWSALPNWISYAGAVLFLISYALYAEVMRENTYLSRVVEVQENQCVIDTGLYSIVRHPMYAASVIMFLSMPLILGSVPAFVIFLTYPLLIAKRISDEEQLLERELEGYAEYKQRIKHKLIPFIW